MRGYTKTVRPRQRFTHDLKVRQIRQYGYEDKRLRDYEEDHLVALEIGDSPDSAKNLWPQPHHVIGNWGSLAKDKLENRLHTLVCHRKLPLAQAQREMRTMGSRRTSAMSVRRRRLIASVPLVLAVHVLTAVASNVGGSFVDVEPVDRARGGSAGASRLTERTRLTESTTSARRSFE